MWEWLHFWKRWATPQEQAASPPTTSAKPLDGTADPPLERVTGKPEPEPVLVRGKAWRNTGTDPQSSLPQPETQAALGIPDVIQRLCHKNSTVRSGTADMLGRVGPKAREAIPALLLAACDIDAAVRKAAAAALDQVDSGWPTDPGAAAAVPDLIKEMGRRSTDISKTASLLLIRIGQSAVPELAQALIDGTNDLLHVCVAQTLGHIGPRAGAAVPALAVSLTSEFTHVRQAAAEALAAIGQASEPAAPALISLLADWNPGVRKAAARSLPRVGRADEVGVTALIQLLADQEDDVREAAVEALAQVGPGAVPLLQEFLQIHDFRHVEERMRLKTQELARQSALFKCRGDERVIDDILREPFKAIRNLNWGFKQATEDQQRMEMAREAAVGALGRIGPAACAAVPILVEALTDKNTRVRSAAARSLGQVGSSARTACPALVRALVDNSQPVRKAAGEALAKIDLAWASDFGIESAVEALVEPLKQSGDAGQLAAEAFVLIGTSSVPVLTKALTHEDRILREAAAKALGRIGAGAQAAIPALVSALQDGSGWVRDAAAEAIQKIDPQGLRDRRE